jgi:PAS domain S-box-containing protein
MPTSRSPGTPADEAAILAHELEVHQAELEAQNLQLRALVDELAATNAALVVARDRYRVLQDVSPTPLVTIDPSRAILDVNRAAEAMLGRPRASVVGAALDGFVETFSRRALRTFVAEVFATGRGRSPDLVTGVDGDLPREVLADGVVVQAATGSEQHAVLAFVDITARRAAETARRKAQDEVLAIVSHDLRGPLNAIVLACDALRSGLDPLEAAECVTAIERAAERSVGLLKDLLQLVQLEGGGLVLDRTWFDVGDLLRTLCNDHAAAAAAGTALTCNLPARPVTMYGDQHRLYQVGANLISNALVHARGAPLEVSVADHADVVVLAFTDQGPGIAEADHARVFDRFRQAGRGRGGAGLGLAIVKGLVSAHGGTVLLTSKPGEGARFEIVVPRGAPAPTASSPSSSSNAPLTPAPAG